MGFNWRAAAKIPITIGGGQIPTKRYFRRPFAQSIWLFSTGIHDNPAFYKYRWQIWTIDEAVEDDWRAQGLRRPWLATTPELSFFDAMNRMRDLVIWRETFLVLTHRCKRDDPAAPWDIALVRRNGNRVAPALADDSDPEFFGHR